MSRFFFLAEAVESVVHDGDTVAMEGFTHLIPHATGHEIIRQRRKRLSLIRMTPDLIYDQLVGMGCAEKMIFSWAGNPGVTRAQIADNTGWDVHYADNVNETPGPECARIGSAARAACPHRKSAIADLRNLNCRSRVNPRSVRAHGEAA